VERLLRWRHFPSVLQSPLLLIAAVAVPLAFRPVQRSEMNSGAALVWQVWWAILPFAVLLTGRGWCAICPFGALGSAAQRFRPATSRLPGSSVRRVGPWLATGSLAAMGFLFLLLSMESNGPLTGALLLAFSLCAVATALLWSGRVWCRYLCPVGLMIGLYSRLAWLKLEVSPGKSVNTAAVSCPLFTSPASSRRSQDCVLCGECLKAPSGESVALRLGAPSLSEKVLRLSEAVAVSVLFGLMVVDALRMVPLYLRYMVWAVPRMGGDYERAMALGIGLVVTAVLLGQLLLVLAMGRGRLSRKLFSHVSLALLPLVVAAQLGHSLQHLMAVGEVVRNLGSELGLLAPGHMPPSDAYVFLWPLKLVQWAILLIGAVVSLRVARDGSDRGGFLPSVVFGGLSLFFLAVFSSPMSVTC
jgi:polyferredoxin